MEISEIAQTLYPFMGSEYVKPQDFLIALLDSVSNDDEATIFGFSDDNLRRFYNGTRPLTQEYAVRVAGKFNIDKCTTFIYERLIDDAPTVLKQQLIDKGVVIPKDTDVSEIVAHLLLDEITSIASQTKVKTKKAKPKLSELELASLRINTNGDFSYNDEVKKFFDDLPVPLDIRAEEMTYVIALFSAYADADGYEVYEHTNDLPNSRLNDFKRQRRNYYKAESIRRGVRDNFTQEEGTEHFEALKEDMYDGIEEVYEEDYDDGVERLKAVLQQSSVITLNGSILSFIPGLLQNSAKKGICHILVNDGKIKWVTEDE
ncbi:ABC-three component system protein [Enterococcus italicus]|uniref:ABC-three component system protein n=1 Tax=Enterococcus italicus TaxID=246144 RepID=UPI002072DE2E|nr:ABC-three component system protein [Enterococcus italicus]